MERRLGRIQARHPQSTDLFEVTLQDTPAGVRLYGNEKKTGGLADLRKAPTCCGPISKRIRPSRCGPCTCKLTRSGDLVSRAQRVSFRFGPLFHQKESRVKAHVLVAFLGMRCG